MGDQIYVVDPTTREPVRVGRATFHEIGITERNDLERWVARDPGLLGEPLLVITSEFSRFDKSNRRLDILALDAKGCLVIVELKLDASHTLADQQAIRYAALCSNMKMDDVIEELARFEDCSNEEACQKIHVFLKTDELPQLGNRPRIILAAGSIQDQELTSCVLWLRGFAVDISCVELTPYRMPDSSQVVVVSRIVIPIPEAQDYMVNIKRRQVVQNPDKKANRAKFWSALAKEFNTISTDLHAPGRVSGVHMCLRFGNPSIHYEWIVRKKENRLDISMHFEFNDREESFRWLKTIKPHVSSISRGIDLEFELVPWGRKWAEARFRIPFKGTFPNGVLAPRAARIMKTLIERTWPYIKP